MRFRIRLISCALFVLVVTYLLYIYFSEIRSSNLEGRPPAEIRQFSRPAQQNDADSDQTEAKTDDVADDSSGEINYDVHTFYYPWYGNPTFDNGSYYHWNHNVLPGPGETVAIPKRYEPPKEIGADFYPQLGCYSSRDPAVLKQHFEWIREAGIGTVVVSWYPPSRSTDQGHSWDDLIPTILDFAQDQRLKVTFHIEPYKDRSPENLRQHVAYIISQYGSHPAFYRYKHRPTGKSKPLFYVYDSYLTPGPEWRQLLRPEGKISVRRTSLDAYFVGLLVSDSDKAVLASSGFDGFYTYFAANGFSYGSTWRNWRALSRSAKRMDLIFIPCVGPGYIDASVRPWNRRNTHARGDHGEYYADAWKAAIDARSSVVGITSFNEWHEGTQIEPAVPYHGDPSRTYLSYEPLESTAYLKLTSQWIGKFNELPKRRIET